MGGIVGRAPGCGGGGFVAVAGTLEDISESGLGIEAVSGVGVGAWSFRIAGSASDMLLFLACTHRGNTHRRL